ATRAFLQDQALKARYRNRLAGHCVGKKDILLHVGCGATINEGWLNIDYSPVDGSFYFDALDPLPLSSASVKHIHCEHFLEHLEHRDSLLFLRECHRVLIPQGTMRVIVPDAEKYMRAYVANDQEFFEKLVNLGGHSEPLHPKNRVVNHSFRMW